MVPEAMAQRHLRVKIRICFYLFIFFFFLFWGDCGTDGRLTAPSSQKATYLAAATLNKQTKTQKTKNKKTPKKPEMSKRKGWQSQHGYRLQAGSRSGSRPGPALLDPCLCRHLQILFSPPLNKYNTILPHPTDRGAANFKHFAPTNSNVFNYCVGNEHYFFQSPLSAILFSLEKPILFIYFLSRQSMASSASSYGSNRNHLLQKVNQCTCALCASMTCFVGASCNSKRDSRLLICQPSKVTLWVH